MDALILFSHGSLLCGAGEALEEHALGIRARAAAPLVEIGYLNYSEPRFLDAVARCADQGATRIVVVPYFLVPGVFVRVDLPKALAEARSQFAGLEFVVADALGYDPRLADALQALAAAPRPRARWRDELPRAARHCRNSKSCPLFDTPLCPHAVIDLPPLPLPDGESAAVLPAKTDLLVLVHGSPRATANEPMHQVLAELRDRNVFASVTAAFLECNEPLIPHAIAARAAAGATHILAAPYFLHTGTHVADDLPGLLEEASDKYPAITFAMTDFLGRAPQITDILADRAFAVQEMPA